MNSWRLYRLTFAGGIRGCIGWRFAYVIFTLYPHMQSPQRNVYSVFEIQAFVVTLVSQIEFGLSDDCSKIRRELCAVMVPTIEGDTKAVNLPLTITLATQD